MKRTLAALALSAMAALPAACGQEAADQVSETAPAATAGRSSPPSATSPGPTGPAAAPGAPAFAVLYPGAAVEDPAVTATGPAGPGGMVTFTTDAEPDAVIAFYRAKAEAAGLSSVMAMNQGEARAYGAAGADAGANLQVVASPTEAGMTSVQLSWIAGG